MSESVERGQLVPASGLAVSINNKEFVYAQFRLVKVTSGVHKIGHAR